MAFRDMTREDRLLEIGRFHSDTPSFLASKKVLTLLHADWRTMAEGICAFVTGENGAGKSTVADDFMADVAAQTGGVAMRGNAEVLPSGEKLPPSWCVRVRTDKGYERPVIKVEIGPRPRFVSLMTDYLLQLGVQATAGMTFGQLTVLAVHHSIEQKVRTVIFDESQEVVEHHPSREAANVFRHLVNTARVQVALMGLPHSTDIANVNKAVRRRTRVRHAVPAFECVTDDPESPYMRFCRDAEAILPFDRPTGLDHPLTALRMHIASEGYPGIYVPLLHAAAGNAIEQESDSITTKVLAQTYREKMEASDAENPFVDEDPDPERYKAILARLKARQDGIGARDAERPRADGRGRLDFTK
ncbi:RecA/RadA recombinase [Methylobacterium sp. RAS18]|nr:RecA/RadA recombinase [Methylobacterium sp. RAS18]